MSIHICFLLQCIPFIFDNLNNLFLKMEENIEINKKNLDMEISNFKNTFINSLGNSTEEQIADKFDHEESYLNFYENESRNYMVVLLYSQCEHILIRVQNNEKNFSVKNFSKYMNEQYETQITQLPSYKTFNELRLVNNCVKHSGFVSKQLQNSNSARWKNNEKVIVTKDYLKEYLKHAKKFIDAVTEKIK